MGLIKEIINTFKMPERLENAVRSCDELQVQIEDADSRYQALQEYCNKLENDIIFEREKHDRVERTAHRIDEYRVKSYKECVEYAKQLGIARKRIEELEAEIKALKGT